MNFHCLANSIITENSLGLIEDIEIPNLGRFKAKTDTGNEAHNVLHGTEVKINKNEVTFKLENGKKVTLPVIEVIKIHIGGGNIDDRPVIQTDCIVNGKLYKNVPFSVTDRSDNNYKVLLGAPFIKAHGGLVDITKKD